MPTLDYPRLFAVLDAGHRRVFDMLEVLHPYTASVDGRWPTPELVTAAPSRRLVRLREAAVFHVGRQHVFHLLQRLAPRQGLLCGLTAAEMVLPAWFGLARQQQLKASQRLAPHVALHNARRWLDRHYRLTDVLDCAEAVALAVEALLPTPRDAAGEIADDFVVADDPPGVQAARAAMTAVAAAMYVPHAGERDRKVRRWGRGRMPVEGAGAFAAKAVLHAALAGLPWEVPEAATGPPVPAGTWQQVVDRGDRFLAAWWQRCRCRLAFADAPHAEIE